MLPRWIALTMLVAVPVAVARTEQPASPRVAFAGDPLPGGAIARLGTLRFKHLPPSQFSANDNVMARVTIALFSPNGQTVATIGQPANDLRVWDSKTGKELPGPWKSGKQILRTSGIAYSPDGSILAGVVARLDETTGMLKGEIDFWDIEQAKTVRTLATRDLDGRGEFASIAFSDGEKILTAVDISGKVYWWEIASGKLLRTWQAPAADKPQVPMPNQAEQTFYDVDVALGPTALVVRTEKLTLINGREVQEIQTEWTIYALDARNASGRVIHHSVTRPDDDGFRIAFSADGKRIAYLISDYTIELRDTATGKLARTIDVGKLVKGSNAQALQLSADGKQLAVATGSAKIILWKEIEPDAKREIDPQTVFTMPGMSFSADGKRLVTGVGGDVRIYDTDTLQEAHRWQGHARPVVSVQFSADGRCLRTNTASPFNPPGDLITWNCASWNPDKFVLRAGFNASEIGKVSPDHTLYVGKAGVDRLNVYGLSTGALLGRLKSSVDLPTPNPGSFSSDGKYYVMLAKDDAGRDCYLAYTMPSCKLLCQMPTMSKESQAAPAAKGKAGSVGANLPLVSFSADGRVAAFEGRDDGRICVFDTATETLKYRLGTAFALPEGRKVKLGAMTQLDLSPDGKWLASFRVQDRQVNIWDLASRTSRRMIGRERSPANAARFAWSHDSRMLAMTNGREIQIWEVSSMKLRKEFSGHMAGVVSLAFSPDGRYLASGSADTTVLIWDVRGP
jgi:WD40 repeat protein